MVSATSKIFVPLIYKMVYLEPKMLLIQQSENEFEEGALEIRLKLQLHGEIYRPDSFVMMLRYCANLKAIRYESTSLNRIVADKSHHVIVA